MWERSRRSVLAALTALVGGCLGGPTAGSGETESPPASPGTPPDRTGPFPAGPKVPPDRPETLTPETVREFVHEYEYRYVYNELWMGDGTEVVVDCGVDRVAAVEGGYEAAVTCTGYANAGGGPRTNVTGTTTRIHADLSTLTSTYRVTEGAVIRRRATGG